MPNWTAEQERAITESGNLLISAAAGAGKTAIMTERIVRLIASGTKVNELLVVTFTKAAAAEMKQRIASRLTELIESSANDEVRIWLHDAASDLDSAGISTIHSFCQDVLRHNPHLVGLDPAFRVADETEAAMLRAEALESIIEQAHEDAEAQTGAQADSLASALANSPASSLADSPASALADSPASALADSPAGSLADSPASSEIDRLIDRLGNDSALAESIIKIYNFIISRPEPLAWLDNAAHAYDGAFDEFALIAENLLMQETKRDLKGMIADAEKLYHEALSLDMERYAVTLASDARDFSRLQGINSYDGMHYALLDFTFAQLPRIKGSTAPDRIKDYRTAQKASIEKIKKRFIMNSEEERTLAKLVAPQLKCVCDLTKRFISEYAALKQDAAIIDFSDMEQYCYEVLKNESAAQEYREKYKYIFIDEYQDTSGVQDAIISAVSRGDNLFMVGDVKQSIYRFRQAEPANFLSKYHSYDGRIGTRIDLNSNFRSRSAVLSATNTLFSQIMLGDVGEIDYSDNAALKSGIAISDLDSVSVSDSVSDDAPNKAIKTVKKNERGSAELILIDLNDDNTNNPISTEVDFEDIQEMDDQLEIYERAEAEAMYVVKRIRELMAEETIFDSTIGRERSLTYSDFSILMRAMSGSALTWVNTLIRCGIPCTAELGDGYFDAIEVQVFINLLRIIDNRRQDIPLMSVLRSPICAFTGEELVKIKTDYDGKELIDRLILASYDDNKAYGIKAKRLLNDIEIWREYVRNNGVEALIGRLLTETDYHNYVGILPGGVVRQANLDMLLERAHIYESNSSQGLHGFIRMLDGMRDNTSFGAARHIAVNAVKIMSIHKSKGLEFPVVFIAGITSKFNKRDVQSSIIVDNELGIGLRLRGVGKKRREPLFRRAAVAKDISKLVAEEMRTLYVAMTRAKEHLILLGADKAMRKFIDKNAIALTQQNIAKANCYAQWLLGAYFPIGLNIENAMQGVETRIENDILKTQYINVSDLKSIGLMQKSLDESVYVDWYKRVMSCDTTSFAEYVNFDYPNIEDSLRPAKRSVTDYMNSEYEYSPSVPRFMREGRKLSAAERGTAVHRLVMNLPLSKHDSVSIANLIEQLSASGKLTSEEARSIYIKGILNLTNSEIWERIIASHRIERELEFTYLCDDGELMQGIIDCCFLEEKEWVIIDYKTTSVGEGESSAEVTGRYRKQLEGYALALRKLSGLPVKEKWVFLLGKGVAEPV